MLSLQEFKLLDKIGRGRFGQVFKVVHKADDSVYAMKVMDKFELLHHNLLEQIKNEIEIQAKLKHKRILRLLAVSQDSKRVFLFSKLVENGNLYLALKKAGKFPEAICGKYMRQLLDALTYLHYKGVMHR